MLLDAVVIILREVLEAALLASIFLAISNILGIRYRWFLFSLGIGVFGAYIYAANMQSISEWFDYTGQELVNGLIQVGIYFSAITAVLFIHMARAGYGIKLKMVTLVMSLTIALGVIREGSEIIIYLQTFAVDQSRFLRVLTGGLLGAGIGCSVGILVYYLLALNVGRYSLMACQLALAVVASGILSQVVPLFEQIDLLPSLTPLWDSSGVVSETSLVGQLMYAVVGYEATPSAWQVALYGAGMAVSLAVVIWGHMQETMSDES